MGPGEAYDIAYETFAPQPEIEDDALSDEDKSNYQAIGTTLLLLVGFCAFATVAYGTGLGLSLLSALLMAFILVSGLFSFGLALLLFRKWPFIVGLSALGLMLVSTAIAIALDLLSGGSTSGLVFTESSNATPEGAMVFGALFGGGCLFLALRLARSPAPFYGLR